MADTQNSDPAEKTGDAAGRDEKAKTTLEAEGIDPATLPDMTDPEQWRTARKEGGGA